MNISVAFRLARKALLLAPLALAPHSPAVAEEAKPAVTARLKTLEEGSVFAKARQSIAEGWDRAVADLIQLTEIAAPPFGESARGQAFAAMLREAGLQNAAVDPIGNVTALRKGSGDGPMLVVAAHLDTVFPAGTVLKVRRDGDRLSAPGVSDDSSGLAAILAFVRALDRAAIRTQRDILFVGDVGEEGAGDLRGVRYLLNQSAYKGRIAMFIALEPGRGWVTNGAVGSKRFRVTFKGPGGHSYGDFGLVNPAYALGRAISLVGQMPAQSKPGAPRTTFNVGVVDGGESVNAIPQRVSMTVDLRSEDPKALKAEVDRLAAIAREASADENQARSVAKGPIVSTIEQVGDRDAGLTPPDSDIVQVATAAMNAMGGKPDYYSGSTDANVPIGLGIPAITLGSGFVGERLHSTDEFLTLDRPAVEGGMQATLAAIIALADGD